MKWNFSIVSWLKEKIHFLAYFCLGIVILPLYRYHLATDTPAYVSVAKKYIAGDYINAINGFWSPLISWLLIPFIKMGIDPLVAFNALGLLSGFIILVFIRKFFLILSIGEESIRIYMWAAIPLCLSVAFGYMTPDFLALPFLLGFVFYTIKQDYRHGIGHALICGFLGAFAAYAKGYNFYFFLAYFLILHSIRYFNASNAGERKRILTLGVAGITFFITLTFPWILLIFHKYNLFSFNTAGYYNFLYFALKLPHPLVAGGLFPILSENSTSSWEDPFLMITNDIIHLSKIDFSALTLHFLRNIIASVDVYQSMSWIAMLILFVSVAYLIQNRDKITDNKIFPIVLLMLIYNIGYLPFLVTKRYLYINMIFLFILTAFLTSHYLNKDLMFRKALIIFIAFSFVFFPIRDLYANRYAGRDNYRLAEIFTKHGIIGNYAADSEYDKTTFIAYFARSKFFGCNTYGDLVYFSQYFFITFLLVIEIVTLSDPGIRESRQSSDRA